MQHNYFPVCLEKKSAIAECKEKKLETNFMGVQQKSQHFSERVNVIKIFYYLHKSVNCI